MKDKFIYRPDTVARYRRAFRVQRIAYVMELQQHGLCIRCERPMPTDPDYDLKTTCPDCRRRKPKINKPKIERIRLTGPRIHRMKVERAIADALVPDRRRHRSHYALWREKKQVEDIRTAFRLAGRQRQLGGRPVVRIIDGVVHLADAVRDRIDGDDFMRTRGASVREGDAVGVGDA